MNRTVPGLFIYAIRHLLRARVFFGRRGRSSAIFVCINRGLWTGSHIAIVDLSLCIDMFWAVFVIL